MRCKFTVLQAYQQQQQCHSTAATSTHDARKLSEQLSTQTPSKCRLRWTLQCISCPGGQHTGHHMCLRQCCMLSVCLQVALLVSKHCKYLQPCTHQLWPLACALALQEGSPEGSPGSCPGQYQSQCPPHLHASQCSSNASLAAAGNFESQHHRDFILPA